MDLISYIFGKNIILKGVKTSINSGSFLCEKNKRLGLLDYIDSSTFKEFDGMFRYCTFNTAPMLDTSRGEYFGRYLVNAERGYGMFDNCTKLTTVPKYDTSNGICFSAMFHNCQSLTTVPNFDTSKGEFFGGSPSCGGMFENCMRLTTVPKFDTSKGKNFFHMFRNCQSLTTVPKFDLSNGENFYGMFSNTRIVTAPEFDTPKGVNFNHMFSYNPSLTTISKINMSNAITSTFFVYGSSGLNEINFEGVIPISISFISCAVLSLESAKGILIALVDYKGTENEFVYSITFNSATWDLLKADGETSPDGTTWENYTLDKGWNV